MPDIRIERTHRLGLDAARQVARRWVEQAESGFDMTCDYTQGDAQDCVQFTRSGASGELRVSGDRFELHARLGFLLGAFKERIEAEISKNLDALLADQATAATGKPVPSNQPAPD